MTLVAVTKYAGIEHVRVLHDLGVRDFGESTVQGCRAKAEALSGLGGIRWHLIGHLQRNKAARALSLCHAIHSLDSERLVREIAAQAARRSLPVPELYVELNLEESGERTGLSESELEPLLEYLRSEPALAPRVRGLMTMAAHAESPEAARPCFRRLRELRDAAVGRGLLVGGGLSMGMSNDFEVAVEEGATVIRVGSMLFENAG